MKNLLSLGLACGLLLSSKSIAANASLMADWKRVSAVEYLYADVSDANTILATIDSGLLSSYQGKGRAAWQQLYREKHAKLKKELQSLPTSGLSGRDARAIVAMRKQMQAFTAGGTLFSPAAKCQNAARKDIAYAELKSALVACFVEISNSLSFEGGKINRVSALDLLHETADPGRRKAVFLAFVPLWQAINGNNEPDSPYRRMIAGAAAAAAKNGSAIDAAAHDVGIDPPEVERWLVQILDAWRESSGDAMIEPWDFRFQAGTSAKASAKRSLGQSTKAGRLRIAVMFTTWPFSCTSSFNTNRPPRSYGADTRATVGVHAPFSTRPWVTNSVYANAALSGRGARS